MRVTTISLEVRAVRFRAVSGCLGERHGRLRAPFGRRVARVRGEDRHERQQHRFGDRQGQADQVVVMFTCSSVLLVLGDLLADLGW